MTDERFFIGREQELAVFEEILRSGATDGRWIVYIYDVAEDPADRGGVGKTWLLREVIRLAKQSYDERYVILDQIVDYSDLKNRRRINVLRNLYQQLRKQAAGSACREFEDACARYQSALQSLTEPGERRQARLDIFEAYADCYNSQVIASGKSRGMHFCDTFEAVEEDIDYLAPADVCFPMPSIKDRSIVVIAGRNPINWQAPNWRGREAQVREIALKPFSEGEAVQYFDQYCWPDVEEHKIRALYPLTKGRPILIALAVDLINDPMRFKFNGYAETIDGLLRLKPDKFLESLVLGINEFSEPKNIAALRMAHVYHRFDRGWLEYLLEDVRPAPDFAALEEELLGLSFVKPQGPAGQFVLHDEMRRLINEHLWRQQDPIRTARIELSARAIEYYDRLIEEEKDERERETLQAERLHHHLYVNVEAGYEHFDQLFKKALLELYVDIQDGYEFFDRRFEEALLAYRISYCQSLLRVLEGFLDRLPEPNKVFVNTYHKGWLLVRQEKLKEARDQISKGKAKLQELGVTERMGDVDNLLGYCHRLLGNWQEALNNYGDSLRYSRQARDREQLAETLNNIANVHRLRGELPTARDYCKISLMLRRELLREQETPDRKRALGNSYYVMGMILQRIGRMTEASDHFRRASRWYADVEDEAKMAWVQKEQGNLFFHMGDYDTAEQYWRRAHSVFQARGMLSDLSDTLNMMGHLRRAEGKMAEAESLSKKALDLAERVGDHFRQAECHLGLCILYYLDRDKHDLAEHHCTEGRNIARQYEYCREWSVFEGILGNIAYDRGDYEEAFDQYVKECKLSAEYGMTRLEHALRELENRLFDLRRDQLAHYCDFVIDGWESEGLAEDYPSAMETFQRMKEYLV